MSLINFTNLDFNQIKQSLKDYLQSNSDFTDYDFEGSNLSTILDVLAYNTYITSYNANMISNEVFIDSATLRENVVSLARNIGYVPRSRRAAKAKVLYNISGFSSTTSTITFQPGVFANSPVSDTNFIFSLPEKIIVPAAAGESVGTVDIFQGQYLEKSWTVDESQANQRYVIPNNGVDTSTLRVKIKESDASSTATEYTLIDNITGITSTSNIYLIQETTDEKYELLFGDGIFGNKLSTGNIIESSYIVTNGKDGNGASFFEFTGTIVDDQSTVITDFSPNLQVLTKASDGDSIETVESIKNYAPRKYSAQNRAVTANDYEAILPSIYPNIESVSAYGGEELNPPQFGRVFIAAKPRNGLFLANSTKRDLLRSLKNYSVAGIVPEFVNLKYLFVELDSFVYYNTNFVGDSENLKTDIVNAVTQYSKSQELNKFGGRFKYSKALSVIDGVNTAITSNITTVKIRRNLNANINVFSQYELCYDNEFYYSNPSYNIKSTGFSVSGVVGTVYMADQVVAGSKIGNLFIFQQTNTESIKIISTRFGTVDYEKGEIIINTVNITSTVQADNVIEIEAIPLSNDVLARKELYLQLDVGNSTFSTLEDSISSGANVSGTRFNPKSSYSNGTKVRGALITSTGESLLVGYVNGVPYYGEYHTMADGSLMTGATHSENSQPISTSPTTSSTSSTSSTSTSSTSTSSYSSSSGY